MSKDTASKLQGCAVPPSARQAPALLRGQSSGAPPCTRQPAMLQKTRVAFQEQQRAKTNYAKNLQHFLQGFLQEAECFSGCSRQYRGRSNEALRGKKAVQREDDFLFLKGNLSLS